MNADTHATSPTPVGCTNFKLRQFTRLVTQHYDQHLAGAGLKITQYSLLTHVDRLGPLAPGELARRTVHITDVGREMRRQAQRRWKTAQVALNDKLGAATVVALHDLLDQGLAAFHEEDTHAC
jgi:hypothetical protein